MLFSRGGRIGKTVGCPGVLISPSPPYEGVQSKDYVFRRRHTMRKQHGFIGVGFLVAIILGAVVLGGGAYFVVSQQSTSQTVSENVDSMQTLPATNTQTQATTNNQAQNTPAKIVATATSNNPPRIVNKPPETYSEYDIEKFRLAGVSKKCVSFEDVIATLYTGFGHQLVMNESKTMYLLFRFSEERVYSWDSSSDQGVWGPIPTKPASRETRKIYHCENISVPKTFFEVPGNITFTELGKQQ